MPHDHGALLAVDLGLKTGPPPYGADNRLIWYRSHNYGSAKRLRVNYGVDTISC